jgi:hypothetical protein
MRWGKEKGKLLFANSIVATIDFHRRPTVPVPDFPIALLLSGTGGPSDNLKGYNIYRADVNRRLIHETELIASAYNHLRSLTVVSGRTYHYAATTVSLTGESAYSHQATAQIPIP